MSFTAKNAKDKTFVPPLRYKWKREDDSKFVCDILGSYCEIQIDYVDGEIDLITAFVDNKLFGYYKSFREAAKALEHWCSVLATSRYC